MSPQPPGAVHPTHISKFVPGDPHLSAAELEPDGICHCSCPDRDAIWGECRRCHRLVLS